MSATGFGILEPLGGRVGPSHTDAGIGSARVPPLATVEPFPGHGRTRRGHGEAGRGSPRGLRLS